MGFCYPGKAAGGDAPPRPECAPRWHERIVELLPRGRLTLLVGSYAPQPYLPKDAGKTLVDRDRAFERFAPAVFPPPHPSCRRLGWQTPNLWFGEEPPPHLRSAH